MLIYKKNCSKTIKIGGGGLRTYEADAEMVVSGKDQLRRLQLKHVYLKKTHITLQFKTDTRYIVYVSLIMSLSNYNLTDEIMDSNNKKDYLILTVTKD